ncbi:hypothetical protein Hanom_Chr15g01384561 [Helianthus anomalus]
MDENGPFISVQLVVCGLLMQAWPSWISSQYIKEQGRFLEGLWQGHGPGKFFGRSANFSVFRSKFFIYTMFGPGLPGLFLVPVSFGPCSFNRQDPPL